MRKRLGHTYHLLIRDIAGSDETGALSMAADNFGPGTSGSPPGAPAPGYYYPGQVAPRRTNQLAIAALVCAIGQVFFWFLTGIAAIVLGHMARRQIRETGEEGDGMALAALILGYIGVAVSVIGIAIFIVAFVAITRGSGASFNVNAFPG